jgi:hypothetical protein
VILLKKDKKITPFKRHLGWHKVAALAAAECEESLAGDDDYDVARDWTNVPLPPEVRKWYPSPGGFTMLPEVKMRP